MRKQIWRKLVAAVVGLAAAVSVAHAQAPTPMPPTVKPLAPTPTVPPVVTPAPAPAPMVVGPVAPMVVAPAPVAGCGTNGYGAYGNGPTVGNWAGTASPVGCGCCASEKTFVFGSCKQFFTPGRTCDGSATQYNGCGGHCGGLFGGHRRDRCPPPPIYPPYGKPANNCLGPFSYLDR